LRLRNEEGGKAAQEKDHGQHSPLKSATREWERKKTWTILQESERGYESLWSHFCVVKTRNVGKREGCMGKTKKKAEGN